jgi:threonine/homoserine/homoserine lactone efflux protein
MASLFTFVAAVAALLVVPGPTNTLLAAAGATTGFDRAAKLLSASVGGYLAAIGFYSLVLGPTVAGNPTFAAALKLSASAYLVLCAARLWRDAAAASASASPAVSPGRVFTVTLLNPKALIFAFVIFPPGALHEIVLYAALFALLAMVTGSVWIAFGGFVAKSAGRFATPAWISRLAAVTLGIFATVIATSAIADF